MNLKIGWLYPDMMSTYGDRGNIITLKYRAVKRNITTQIFKISLKEKAEIISRMDMLFMGGAQDKQQEIVNRDLESGKGKYLAKALDDNKPALFICGAYQFMGNYYLAADGAKIKGLGIFDLYTKSPGLNVPRCIGNLIVKPNVILANERTRQLAGERVKPVHDLVGTGVVVTRPSRDPPLQKDNFLSYLVGFENHGGRTYLKDNSMSFSKVLHGFGNNGEDGLEGMIFKNSIGTYLHGPVLPKNPELADYLIGKALEIKYKKNVRLKPLDDEWEKKAREVIIRRYL